jgi:hypothetical protein
MPTTPSAHPTYPGEERPRITTPASTPYKGRDASPRAHFYAAAKRTLRAAVGRAGGPVRCEDLRELWPSDTPDPWDRLRSICDKLVRWGEIVEVHSIASNRRYYTTVDGPVRHRLEHLPPTDRVAHATLALWHERSGLPMSAQAIRNFIKLHRDSYGLPPGDAPPISDVMRDLKRTGWLITVGATAQQTPLWAPAAEWARIGQTHAWRIELVTASMPAAEEGSLYDRNVASPQTVISNAGLLAAIIRDARGEKRSEVWEGGVRRPVSMSVLRDLALEAGMRRASSVPWMTKAIDRELAHSDSPLRLVGKVGTDRYVDIEADEVATRYVRCKRVLRDLRKRRLSAEIGALEEAERARACGEFPMPARVLEARWNDLQVLLARALIHLLAEPLPLNRAERTEVSSVKEIATVATRRAKQYGSILPKPETPDCAEEAVAPADVGKLMRVYGLFQGREDNDRVLARRLFLPTSGAFEDDLQEREEGPLLRTRVLCALLSRAGGPQWDLAATGPDTSWGISAIASHFATHCATGQPMPNVLRSCRRSRLWERARTGQLS